MATLAGLDRDIAEAYSHERDVSTRDGIQSKFANKVRNRHIFKILEAENALPPLVEKHGFKAAPVEVWGGGQVLQPANFLKEDPFWNLAKMHEVAPNIDLQCLNRGRQAWGFGPVSPEVLESGLQAASDRGLKIVRVFDMMNDTRNLEATFEAVRKINTIRPGVDRLLIEGAVSYNSEPKEGARAWTLDEYAAYAVKLAKMGADEIVIKNYAGTGKYEMVELVKKMRLALDAAGFKDKHLNLHMHGHYPELMADALKAGADKVDVGIGELAGGPSFTDAVALIEEQLKRKGYNTQSAEFRAAFDNNEIVKQVRRVEQVIHDELAIQQKEAPIPTMKEFTEDQIEKYRMAAGALSDVWTRIVGISRTIDDGGKKIRQIQRGKITLTGDAALQQLFERVLERSAELWEVGGRFNTVTPGAKIACDQALALTMIELDAASEPRNTLPAYKPLEEFKPQNFLPQYVNIVTGRFGENQGMNKDVGKADQKMRDAFLMYQAMQTVNKAIENREINHHEQDAIKDRVGKWLPFERDKGFNLNVPGLQHILKEAQIGEFRLAVENLDDEPLRDRLRYQLHQERSPDPKEGLEEGQKIVDRLRGSDAKPLRDAAMIKRALRRINDAILKGEVTRKERDDFTNAADIGKTGARLTLVDEGKDGKPATFKLDESTDEKKAALDQLLAQSSIANVQQAVECFTSEKLKRVLHVDLTPLDVRALHAAGAPVSSPDIAPVIAMLVRDNTKGFPNDSIYMDMVSQIAQDHGPLDSVMRAHRTKAAAGAAVK